MPFQEKIPEWNAEGVEPPASKKAAGWQAGEKPPADYWNWQMNRTYRALRELQEKALHKDDVTASDIPTANGSDIQSEIENLKSSVSDGKAAVAGAITDMGVPTSPSDTFQQMAENIRAIQTGPDTGDATAVAGDILSGKTAYARGEKLIGTMPNRGAITITPGPSDQSIPAGYHNGNGKVAGVVFDPSKVLEGTTIAGTAGTMPNRTGHVNAAGYSRSGTTLRLQPQPGYYPGGSGNSVQIDEPNLLPENIRQGKSIFGVAGSLVPGAAIKSVQRGISQIEKNPVYVTIPAVDRTKSIILAYTDSWPGNHAAAKLENDTTLHLYKFNTSGNYVQSKVAWQVIEFDGDVVIQQGETWASANHVERVTIASVDLTRSFLVYSVTYDSPSNTWALYGYINNPTQIDFVPPSNSGAKIYWFVITI
jgi:hypothetical protein